MNCTQCRDILVACIEGLLEQDESLQCQAHLETCAACRAEYSAIARLHQRLLARGQAAADVSLVEPVMRRVRTLEMEPERNKVMNLILKHRWGLGLGATAAAATGILLLAIVSTPRSQAAAIEVMTKGAQAVSKLSSIHLRGQVRTAPADNFDYINADSEFYPIELWKQFEPELKWRVEKPQRVAVMDGQSTVMLINNGDWGVKFPDRSTGTTATEWPKWLHRIANLSTAIHNEIDNARAKGWKITLTKETGPDGKLKSVVTVMAAPNVPDSDYLKNMIMDNADTRRVYRFDAQTELLESVEIYLVRPSGEVQIFGLNQIDYNQPIDPREWKLDLPADISWYQGPQILPDNDKYASMTAEQAARVFFEACASNDWVEAAKFLSPINEHTKQYLGGLQIVSIGQSFTSTTYEGRYVPYAIRMPGEDFNFRVSNDNLAKRFVIVGVYDDNLKLYREIKWTTEPEIPTNNDVYAKMSPADVVKAYVDARWRFDWDEMRKFIPESESDFETSKSEVAAAENQGLDGHNHMSVITVGDAFWSAEQSAWFVKCHERPELKKWNLALRKDNPAGRWEVDGGY